MARGIESCQAWLEQLCWHVKKTPRAWEDARIGAQVALLKVHCGQLVEMCCREAQQVFGGFVFHDCLLKDRPNTRSQGRYDKRR